MIWIAVTVASGLGAACRYLVDHALTFRSTGSVPWGTITVNVSGSLLAGALAALVSAALLPDRVGLVVLGGFLASYTTFSTAMYESVRLFEEGRPPLAVANLLGPLVLSVLAALSGFEVATRIVG